MLPHNCFKTVDALLKIDAIALEHPVVERSAMRASRHKFSVAKKIEALIGRNIKLKRC